jgi:hypothetical protein
VVLDGGAGGAGLPVLLFGVLDGLVGGREAVERRRASIIARSPRWTVGALKARLTLRVLEDGQDEHPQNLGARCVSRLGREPGQESVQACQGVEIEP